ncbi:hypothetical protein VNO77_06902 [Canavalia gladiata]|uniref:Uncharacterized protein n=1 Tax=Canavalia gladiata TaxID=3824 RepID=A0AAN9QWC3_CANGL
MAPKMDIQQILSPVRKLPTSGGNGSASSSTSSSTSIALSSTSSSTSSSKWTKPLTIQQIFFFHYQDALSDMHAMPTLKRR